MPLEKTDRSLNASQLVNKHRAANMKYGCQQICALMKEHGVTVEDLGAFLNEPSKKEALMALKSKLFSHTKEEVVGDGELGGQGGGASQRATESKAESKAEAPAKTQPKARAIKTK